MSHEQITDSTIIALRNEAAAAGDTEQVEICSAALHGDAVARRACAEVVNAARAMEECQNK